MNRLKLKEGGRKDTKEKRNNSQKNKNKNKEKKDFKIMLDYLFL